MDVPSRRRFLQVATCSTVAVGVGLVVGLPSVGVIVDPAGKRVIVTPTEPLDLGSVESFIVGAPPRRVDVIAPDVRDAWTASHDVVLGAAWITRAASNKVTAFSAVCPHLGCAITWDESSYVCPCHDSRFGADGTQRTGPAERGLDPLPVEVRDGRLSLTWVRYKLGTSTRGPA